MPSTYSPLLRLELVGAGEQSGLWGDTTNKNLGQLLEQAIAGVTTVSLSGGAGDYTLTALDGTYDEARSAVLKFIGSPSGTKNIIIPTETKLYVVRNECGQTITVKTAAQVTGVTLLNGEATLVFCDGTNAIAGIATAGVGPTTVANGGTGATSFVAGFVKSPGGTGALTSSATINAATELSGIVGVGNGGTGRNTLATNALLLGNGTGQVQQVVGSSNGQVLSWNGTTWTPSALPSTITNVAGIAPIGVSVIGGTATVGIQNGTQVGQLLVWSGTAWEAQTPSSGGVISFNGRAGPVTSQASDYSSFYPSLTGSYDNPAWIIKLAGSKIDGSVTNSTQLSGVAIGGFVRATESVTQSIDGAKTFTGPASFVGGVGVGVTGIVRGNGNSAVTAADGPYIVSVIGSTFVTNATNATNAATVTNGVYTNVAYSDPAWIVSLAGSKVTNAVLTTTVYNDPAFINTLSGNKITSGQVFDSARLGGVAAASYARLDTAQTYTAVKTYTSGGAIVIGTPVSVGTAPSITSTAYNFTSNTSIFTTGGTDVQIFVQGNQRFRLDSSGNLNISGTLTQGSDPRLKDDIQDYTKGLDDLQNIRVRSWTYNGKGGTTKGRKAIGVVATEIEAYMPEMIINAEGKLNPEDTQTTTIKNVDSLQMTWLLVKSVQELKAEVDALKAQLAAK